MQKKVVLLFSFLVVAASILSYKLGSTPVALAKGRSTAQEDSDRVAPPLPAPPAEWVVYNIGSLSPAKATRGAVSGVQHVADCISVTTSNQATATGGGSVLLLDGSNIITKDTLAFVASAWSEVSTSR
jgi:hypothetical protein